MCRNRNNRATVCAGILLTLGACATASPGASEFCLIYEPVYVSDRDTGETVAQVMRNNAAWEALCDDRSGAGTSPSGPR